MHNHNSLLLPTLLLSIKNFLVCSFLFFLPIYFTSIGFSGLKIGILLSVFAFTSLVSSSLSGLFSDRYPIKYLSAVSFGFLTAYLLGLSTTKNFWLTLALFFMGGLGNNSIDISLTSFALKVIEKKDAGTRLGIFNATKTIAAGLGALLGGLLLAKVAFTKVFLLLALSFFVTIVGTIFIKKIGTFRYSIEHYRGDLWGKEIFRFITLIFIFTLHWGAEGTSYSLLLKENFGLSQQALAWYIGTVWLVFGYFIFYVGRNITETTPFRKIIYPGLVLSGLGHILFTYPFIPFSYLFRLVHEFGDAAFEMFLVIGIHRYFPSERIGGTSGVVLTVTVAGRLVGSLIFGPVGDLFGYQYPFIISGILTLFCLPIANRFKR